MVLFFHCVYFEKSFKYNYENIPKWQRFELILSFSDAILYVQFDGKYKWYIDL